MRAGYSAPCESTWTIQVSVKTSHFAGSATAIQEKTSQADNDSSNCFGGIHLRVHLRRNNRTNSFARRDSSSALMMTQVSKHKDVSQSGLTTTPSACNKSGGRFRKNSDADMLRY
jgi:hypothetical protein